MRGQRERAVGIVRKCPPAGDIGEVTANRRGCRALACKLPFSCEQWVTVCIFDITDNATAIAKLHAAHHVSAFLRGTTGNGAVIDIGLQAFEIVVDDEVYHARHGIGTVNRSGAACQDIDAFQKRGRDRVNIDRVAEAERQCARPVNQHQSPVLAQIAQIERLCTKSIAANRRRIHAASQLRHLDRNILNGNGALQLYLLAAQGADRAGRRQAGAFNARSRYDNALFGVFGSRGVLRHYRRGCHRRNYR